MRVCVILLNWNGWENTIECLESLFQLAYPDFRVVVCDNASSDQSLEKIKEWARGIRHAQFQNPCFSWLEASTCAKPIHTVELTREQALSMKSNNNAPLTLIQNGANLGFAGGNNVGLHYCLNDQDCEFFWLLNNDTVVHPDALSALVRVVQQQPRVGFCGSLNLSYYDPGEVQAQGGKNYNRWTARVYTPSLRIEELDSRPCRIHYINGASTLVTRALLESVGLMEESYFLYFEEMDWTMRAKGKFDLGYARDSVIYHKEGASIGTNCRRDNRSLLSDKYLSRNRVLFTRKFFPWALPSVLISVVLSAASRLWSGDVERAKAMLSFMLEGLSTKIDARR